MKTKALILNVGKGTFMDDKKGEMVGYSKVTLGVMAESSENFVGYLIEEITGKVEDFHKITKYQGRVVDLDLVYKKVDKKNYRAKIEKIGGETL